jgi:hypothetical protein
MQYRVVIYCNRRQKKILYRSRTIYPARNKYNQYLAENKPFFPRMWDWLGNHVQYELLLVGNNGEHMDKYKAPSGVVYNVGKTLKDGFVIKDIQPYFIEEKFKYHNANKMVEFKDVVKLMVKEPYTKTIITFTNKVLIEVFEKDEPHLFILKNKSDAQRLYAAIKKFYLANHIGDCFFFTPPTRGWIHRELYVRLSEKLNISISQLKKISTRA